MINCDAMPGYYGVVVTAVGVETIRKKGYLKWKPFIEKAEKA